MAVVVEDEEEAEATRATHIAQEAVDTEVAVATEEEDTVVEAAMTVDTVEDTAAKVVMEVEDTEITAVGVAALALAMAAAMEVGP